MSGSRICSSCQEIHPPPYSRRCLQRVNNITAEAGSQASSVSNISELTISQTVAQVSHLPEEVVDHRGDNQQGAQGGKNVNVLDNILDKLNTIVDKVDSVEKQALEDRNRVLKLCEQFDSDTVGNIRKKIPEKNSSKRNDNGVNVCATNETVVSASRHAGARPRVNTDRNTATRATSSQDFCTQLLTYEQFLALHQAHSGE